MQTSRGSLGLSKHRKSGTPGHNSDMIQTSRELNREKEIQRKLREKQKGPFFGSIRELLKQNKRNKR
jgi:hypothetical protein